jgi:hypothetical protein
MGVDLEYSEGATCAAKGYELSKNQLERQHVDEKTNKLLLDASKGVVVDGSMIWIRSASGLDELHQGII